jgi:hypothetical protein
MDVGAAQRILGNHAFVLLFAKSFRLRTMLDFGGGDGLLCRLLRDRGLDAYTIDDYSEPTYARFFKGCITRSYDLLTAFEVFEHLPYPSMSLDHLFESKPRFIIGSTEIYSGQDSTWWYLSPQSGQHVFFYSRTALRLLAARHEYSYYEVNGRHVFTKQPLTPLRLRAISCLTSGRTLQLFRATLPFFETWNWINRDFESVRKALSQP